MAKEKDFMLDGLTQNRKDSPTAIIALTPTSAPTNTTLDSFDRAVVVVVVVGGPLAVVKPAKE